MRRRLMVPQKSGLIVAISGYAAVTYTYGVVFGMCKTAVDRMARDMAIELEAYNVASLSLWQGLTFTERARRNLRRSPEMTKQTVTDPAVGCSPEFPGRVIAALAADPDVMKRSGGSFITAEVARDYGDYRRRRQGHPVVTRRTRRADLASDRTGRPWTLTAWRGWTSYWTDRTSSTA